MSNHFDAITVVHENPVWRSRANFLIVAEIPRDEVKKDFEWEQIWANEIRENVFEICCIPFFAYDLALGDVVSTIAKKGRSYVINRVEKQSGRYVFRAWLSDVSTKESLTQQLTTLGCMIEIRFSESRLISIDAATSELAVLTANLLMKEESLGSLAYETGLNEEPIAGASRTW